MKVVSNNMAFVPEGQSEIAETKFLNKLNFRDVKLYTIASKEDETMKILTEKSIGGKHPYITLKDVKSDKAIENAMVYLYNHYNDLMMEIEFINCELITTCPDYCSTDGLKEICVNAKSGEYIVYTPYLTNEEVELGESIVGTYINMKWKKAVMETLDSPVTESDGIDSETVITEVKGYLNGEGK